VKEFLKYNFKTIIQITIVLLLVILLVRSFTSIPDRSELLKYKLDKIDQEINDLRKTQSILLDSLRSYKDEIKKIDNSISNIRLEKKTINNYYEIQSEKIKGLKRKEIDSLLRKRYKY
jgi:septal ring factor EnvC (AmiA/AmiB activator)